MIKVPEGSHSKGFVLESRGTEIGVGRLAGTSCLIVIAFELHIYYPKKFLPRCRVFARVVQILEIFFK